MKNSGWHDDEVRKKNEKMGDEKESPHRFIEETVSLENACCGCYGLPSSCLLWKKCLHVILRLIGLWYFLLSFCVGFRFETWVNCVVLQIDRCKWSARWMQSRVRSSYAEPQPSLAIASRMQGQRYGKKKLRQLMSELRTHFKNFRTLLRTLFQQNHQNFGCFQCFVVNSSFWS